MTGNRAELRRETNSRYQQLTILSLAYFPSMLTLYGEMNIYTILNNLYHPPVNLTDVQRGLYGYD
jgi:hypothetical protein